MCLCLCIYIFIWLVDDAGWWGYDSQIYSSPSGRVNEVQEAVNSPAEMVQFHALSLLHDIKQKDRLAVSKASKNMT